MANTTDTQVIWSSNNMALIQLTNKTDGTDESNARKVDLDGSVGGVTLTGPSGGPVTHVSIMELKWNIQGINYVQATWDHSSNDDMIHLMSGIDQINYYSVGGFTDPNSDGDTRGAATVGDILITTSGAVSGGDYNITMLLKLHG